MNRPTCETCDHFNEIEDGHGTCNYLSAGKYQNLVGCPIKGSVPFPGVSVDNRCGQHPHFKIWQENKKVTKVIGPYAKIIGKRVKHIVSGLKTVRELRKVGGVTCVVFDDENWVTEDSLRNHWEFVKDTDKETKNKE